MLITLEGIDGSGKTSVSEAVRESFPEVIFTSEPTDSWYGEAVLRSVGDPEADPLAELFLYTADHADHIARVVRPAINEGTTVISDRYSDSRYAYQGATLEDRLEDPIEFIMDIHGPWTIPPDLTILYDVDPETGARRSGSTNKFERVDYLRRVRENYLQLREREPGRFITIDASRSLEEMIEETNQILEEHLG